MAGVQCNLLLLEAEWTNPKCQMSYSIILTEINFDPESLNLIVTKTLQIRLCIKFQKHGNYIEK